MIGNEQILSSLAITLLGYMIGSIPMGYLTVKIFKHQDITKIGSGRTGGTNAMRAGGLWLGLLTGALDFAKGFLAIWITRWLMPTAVWPQVLAGVAAVFGHNWSIWLFLITKRFNGGAGTGPNVGAAIAFWPPVALIVVPIILFFVFIVGYASLASIAAALAIIIVLYYRAAYVGTPWQYVAYSFMTASLVIVALLPNIKRLSQGIERRVGIFAKKSKNT